MINIVNLTVLHCQESDLPECHALSTQQADAKIHGGLATTVSHACEFNHGISSLRRHQKCNRIAVTKRSSQTTPLDVSDIYSKLYAYLRGEEVDVTQAQKLRAAHKHEDGGLWIFDSHHKAIVNAVTFNEKK